MCNAYRHSEGCNCGFGPPYPYVAIEGRTEWAEDIIDEPWLARSGLEELAWDPLSIDEFVAFLDGMRDSDMPRLTIVDRVKELLAPQVTVEEEVWHEWVKVPLYRFGAPPVKQASVTFREGDTLSKGSGWALKVFGVGTGPSTELSVTRDKEFVAEYGACKQVFVPVRMRIARVTTTDQEGTKHPGVRAEVAVPRKKKQLALQRRGCEEVGRGLCRERREESFKDAVEYWLAGDASGAIHTHLSSWETDITREVSLKLKKIVEIGPRARIRRTRRLSLAFRLPAGHDYRGYVCRSGLWWESP